MKKFILLLALMPALASAQDWYDDTRSDGAIVFFNSNTGDNLFSARINTTSGISLNLFNWQKNYQIGVKDPIDPTSIKWVNSKDFDANKPVGSSVTLSRKFKGWGVSIKTKAEQGLGSLIASGQFADGFSTSLYFANERVISTKEKEILGKKDTANDTYRFGALVFGFNNSQYRFYRPDLIKKEQFSDFESVSGGQIGYSFFSINTNSLDNLVLRGLSVGLSVKNNYKKLTKFDIKEVHNQVVGKDSVKVFQKIDKDGYTYALEDANNSLTYFGELTVRGNFGIIPEKFNKRICFLGYPEVAYAKEKLSVNLGFGVQFLKENQPLMSIAGIFAKFSDVFNSGASKDPFLKRTFELGVTASLNVLTGQAKN